MHALQKIFLRRFPMIQKFRFGTPISTDATVEELPIIQVTKENLTAAASAKKDCPSAVKDAEIGVLTIFSISALDRVSPSL